MTTTYPADLEQQIAKLTAATAKDCARFDDGPARMRSLLLGIKAKLAERTGQPLDDRRGRFDQLYALGYKLGDRIAL